MEGVDVTQWGSMGVRGKAAVIMFLTVVLGACAGMTIASEQDPAVGFDTYQTYEWILTRRAPVDVRVTAALRAQIKEDVDRHLAEKGYRLVDADGDFGVAYHVTIDGETNVQQLNAYYGAAWKGDWSHPGTFSRRYEEGSLIIDALDGASGRLIWRGSATAEVRQRVEIEERSQRVAEAVRKVLERFPSR
jgi:hypothetical protein